MERLKYHASQQQKTLDLEVIVINNTFDLFMRGLKEEYNQGISTFLNQIINEKKVISVAQLSMVDAARQIENESSKTLLIH